VNQNFNEIQVWNVVRNRNEKLVEKRMYVMVDRIGMMRLRIKREKKEKEAILRGIREKFDKYADIVTDKIVNDNCVFLLGDINCEPRL
jgi:hypothetical protein